MSDEPEPEKKQEPKTTTSWGSDDPDLRDKTQKAIVPPKKFDPSEIG